MENSPYTPGAGHAPPLLVAREQHLQRWEAMLADLERSGRRRAADTFLVGPRGVGKTVLLGALAARSTELGFQTVSMQAVGGSGGLIGYLIRRIRERAGRDSAWRRAWERLESVSVGAFGFSVGVSRRPAASDPGLGELTAMDLAAALADLATDVRADAGRGGLVITLDEAQAAGDWDLGMASGALARLNVEHPGAPVVFAGAGLPSVRRRLRDAGVTHPERLFGWTRLPTAFDADQTVAALVGPAAAAGVAWADEALEAVREASGGHPAHVQLFADAVWRHAPGPHEITAADARHALTATLAELTASAMGPEWDGLTDREREYAAALAVLGGQASARDVAATLGRTRNQVGAFERSLRDKGFVHRPSRDEVALTIPAQRDHVLAVYEDARTDARTAIAPLRSLWQRAAAIR